MFEKEIKFIGDFCFNQVKSLGNVFTLDKIIATGIHPAIVQYISAELDYMIYSDRRKLLQQSYFDYTGKEISDHFHRISNEIKRNKKISIEDSKKLVFQAVSFNVNYLVRPRWSLTKLIFNDQPIMSVDEMKMMLNYLYYYDYFRKVIKGYISKRNLLQISSSEFDLVLNKIDRELLSSNQEQLIQNSFTSIGDFFNIGGVDKNIIPLMAVEILFKEKNLLDLLLKLRKSIPNGVKKQYDKNELERLIFAPHIEVEEETELSAEPEIKSEELSVVVPKSEIEPEEEKSEVESPELFEKTGTESFLTPEEEQALLSLYNEEQKIAGEVKDEEKTSTEPETVEEEISQTETTELSVKVTEPSEEVTVTTEAKSFKEISEKEEEIEGIINAISDDIKEEEIKIEELSVEDTFEPENKSTEDLSKVEIETEPAVEGKNIESETVEEFDSEESDLFKPGFEKEIVQEMIKDFYGGSEPESSIQDEIKQKTEEDSESIAEPEEVKNKIESLEDELLNIFEGLDKIETIPEKEDNSSDESIKALSAKEEETISENQLTDPRNTDDFEDYLKNIDEVIFSDKKEKRSEEEKPYRVKEVQEEPENKVTKSEKYTSIKETAEQPAISPRHIRTKDLFSYLRRKDIKKIVFLIFANDEEDFANTAERIMDCHSYKEASEILKAVFTSYKISPYSKEAITFTNAVSNYFRQA